MRKLRFALLLALITFTGEMLKAQLTINNAVTPATLVNTLMGPGVNPSAIVLNCPALSFGTFSGGGPAIGIPNGIVLATGETSWIPGPNTGPSDGFDDGSPGDADLSAIISDVTNNACVLEFDITPSCDTIQIAYVFGSEEYPEFVGSVFNDVFAFLISGPGIVGVQNIALIPGTTTPVAINTVNSGSFPMYYVDNFGGPNIGYDGFTTPLIAMSAVIPCSTYHIKLAIADAVDGAWDSGVFLEQNGFKCASVILDISSSTSASSASNQAVEACVDGIYTITRGGDTTVTDTIWFNIGGTAVMGVDYAPVSNYVVFGPGDTSQTIIISPFADGVLEGGETVYFIITDSSCGGTFSDTASIIILDPPVPDAGPDLISCSGDSTVIGLPAVPGYVYNWTPTTGMNDPSLAQPSVSQIVPGAPYSIDYIMNIVDSNGCTGADTMTVLFFLPSPPPVLLDDTTCQGSPASVSFTGPIVPGTIYNWTWTGTPTVVGSGAGPISLTWAGSGWQYVTLFTNTGGCISPVTTDSIYVYPTPSVSINPVAGQCLDGNSFSFGHTGTYAPGTTFLWTIGPGATPSSSTLVNPSGITFATSGTKTVTLTITDHGCPSPPVSVNFQVYPQPVPDFNWVNICQNDLTQFTSTTPGAIVSSSWNFGDGSTATGPVTSHTFAAPGAHNVTLTVIDANGCTADTTLQVVIHPNPVPDFSYVHKCFYSITEFTDLSTLVDPFGSTISSYSWDFGDPPSGALNTSTLANPVHNYPAPGFYTVTFTVTSDLGCTQTLVRTLEVPTVYPVIAIGDSVCVGYQAHLFASGDYPGTTMYWYDAPGAVTPIGTGNSLITPPLAATTYYYVNIVEDLTGCKSLSTAVQAYVIPTPTVIMQPSATALEVPNAIVEFHTTPSSLHGIVSMVWDFGDGSTSTEANPVHQYQLPGLYTVTLFITDKDGCTQMMTWNELIRVEENIRLHVPNAFTPNGDGINDYFFAETMLVKQLTTQVYDRWGKLIFESGDLSFRWSGVDEKGYPASEGAYTYLMKGYALNGQFIERHGTVLLMR